VLKQRRTLKPQVVRSLTSDDHKALKLTDVEGLLINPVFEQFITDAQNRYQKFLEERSAESVESNYWQAQGIKSVLEAWDRSINAIYERVEKERKQILLEEDKKSR
jgi:hypothetical protein